VVGTEVHVYWCSRRHQWSVRARGRVVGHVGFATIIRCRFIVQAGGRARALERGQRSVHAWIRGTLAAETVDNGIGMIRVGYNYRHAATFTTRPAFAPIYAARLVTFHADGHAYALP
jgi:hypothetical protein